MRHYLAHNSPDGGSRLRTESAAPASAIGRSAKIFTWTIARDAAEVSAGARLKGWLKSPEASRQHRVRQVHRDRPSEIAHSADGGNVRLRRTSCTDRLPRWIFAELAALASGHARRRAQSQTALKLGIFRHARARRRSTTAALGPPQYPQIAARTALIAKRDGSRSHYSTKRFRAILVDGSLATVTWFARRLSILGGLILFDEAFFQTWSHLEQTIRTGLPARPTDMFSKADPKETERFIRAMGQPHARGARAMAAYVADRIDLSKVSKLADIGGGAGDVHGRDASAMASFAAPRFTICPATLEGCAEDFSGAKPA